MTTEKQNLVVQGRLVWVQGKTLFEGKQKTDYNTNAPLTDPAGNPLMEYGFGLSVPKIDPATGQHSAQFTALWEALHKEAFTLYPSGQLPPDFAMKFKDGDTIDHNGKPFSAREGYGGCLVLTCTTQIPIKYFRHEGGQNILVNNGIKCGDYVNVQVNVKAHPAKGKGKAGLYVNPFAVQLIAAGPEIVNAPSGDAIFGGVMPTYAGQMMADTAPQMPAQTAPVAPQMAQPAAPMQMPNQQMAPPVQAPAAPHYDVLPTTHQPVAPTPSPAQVHQAQMMAPQQTPVAPTIPNMPTMPQ